MNKPAASELFAKLLPTLGEDESRAIVKGKIDKGELADDLGVAPVISQKDLSGLLENLAKAFTPPAAEPVTATATPKTLPKTFSKGAPAAQSFVGNETSLDLSALEESFALVESKIDSVVQTQDRHYNQIVKGVKAVADINQATFVAMAEMDRRNTELTNVVNSLVKAVESIAKGGPKAVSPTTAVVAHPGESAGAQAAAGMAQAAVSGGAAVEAEMAMYTKVESAIQGILVKGDVADDRKLQARNALAELLSGELPSNINKNYGLGVA